MNADEQQSSNEPRRQLPEPSFLSFHQEDSAVTSVRRPKSVTAAWIIWMLLAVLFFMDSFYRVAVDPENGPKTLILGSLLMLCAFKVRRGRDWARITLAILSTLVILAGLASSVSLAILLTLAMVAANAPMFTPAANAYFRPSAKKH